MSITRRVFLTESAAAAVVLTTACISSKEREPSAKSSENPETVFRQDIMPKFGRIQPQQVPLTLVERGSKPSFLQTGNWLVGTAYLTMEPAFTSTLVGVYMITPGHLHRDNPDFIGYKIVAHFTDTGGNPLNSSAASGVGVLEDNLSKKIDPKLNLTEAQKGLYLFSTTLEVPLGMVRDMVQVGFRLYLAEKRKFYYSPAEKRQFRPIGILDINLDNNQGVKLTHPRVG